MHEFGWFGMVAIFFRALIGIALLVGLILLIIWLVRRLSNGHVGGQTPAAQTPKEIAQARYARGEISREEYQQIITDLG